MTIAGRPSEAARSMVGGSIQSETHPCRHALGAGVLGTVAVVGAGKMGLPLAAQFASHRWHVIAVDVQQGVVDSINAGKSHVDEPGVADLVMRAHADGLLSATTDGAAAAAQADVVVLIVPVMLDDAERPDYRFMDAAVASIASGIHEGSLVIFETTLPVGDTRERFTPRLEAATGLVADRDFFVAFSPERLYSGAALRNLATYPKLVGGIRPASTTRAAEFYAAVLDTEIIAMSSSEAAEFSKLAETTYRDVNIALANEFARYAEKAGVDVGEVIAAANSQPYSHIHRPGLGVGGHCIPVYPHFLLARAPELELVAAARRVNDGQVGHAIRAIKAVLGGLDRIPILVLGLTYREGVHELAYSRALPLIDRLTAEGALVSAYDPLLDAEETARCLATPWAWGTSGPFRAVVTQTADPRWAGIRAEWFPDLELVYDGRSSLRELALPSRVRYLGVGAGVRATMASP